MPTDESVGAGDSTPDRVRAHGCFNADRMYMYMFKFSHSLSMQSNRWPEVLQSVITSGILPVRASHTQCSQLIHERVTFSFRRVHSRE